MSAFRLAFFVAACTLAQVAAQEDDLFEGESSGAPKRMDEVPASERGPGALDPRTGEPLVRDGEDEWQAQKRRLQESGRSARSGHAGTKKRKRKKSWLTLLGVGGEDKDGKPKP